MKIRLLSDLHGEFYRSKAVPFPADILETRDEDVLVLAGDIDVGAEHVFNLIDRFVANGARQVVYVPGNHEFYGNSINEFLDGWIRFLDASYLHGRVHLLYNGSVKIGDTTFIGTPLWTNFRQDHFAEMMARTNISDFTKIKDFKPADARKEFDFAFEYLKQAYETTEGKKVIVTHFLPAVECIVPKYRGPNLLNNYFANDLGNWIVDLKDVTWLFGHTHDSVDMTIGETRLIANPRGYFPFAINPTFQEEFII
jgi:predicted phosphodiesterase